MLRLFFALWPDAGARAGLAAEAAALRRDCGGRATAAGRLHLTLAFLGNVPVARLPELEALAALQDVRPFVLKLDRVGWWPRQRLVWAGTQSCPRELEALASALAGALRAGGFSVEHRPFMPHVTLLRDARRAPPRAAFGPLVWHAAGFVLAQSEILDRGIRYRVVARWPPGMESPGTIINRR